MFAAEFEPAPTTSRRRSPRASVSLHARIGAGGSAGNMGGFGRTLCKVVDISIHGARLQTYTALKRGSTIWLTLPGVGQVSADVIWADDYTAGCQFQSPLEPALLETLLAR